MKPPTLAAVTHAMTDIAPLSYAGSWDNVGLLIQGGPMHTPAPRALLAIDLNRLVLEEALAAGVQIIVAYHPTIFGGLKRLTDARPDQAVVLDCVRAGVSVFSPHTALDAAPGGVCDWLIDGAGEVLDRAPIEVSPAAPPALEGQVGAGRVGRLATPAPLTALVARMKAHLGLAHIRVAASAAHAAGAPISSLAVCPGAGGSLLEKLRGPELFITGEMRHHDILARVARGDSVMVTDHTNTERGYLPVLAERLRAALPGLTVQVSEADRDPLVIW